jgi:hypothetical protein
LKNCLFFVLLQQEESVYEKENNYPDPVFVFNVPVFVAGFFGGKACYCCRAV